MRANGPMFFENGSYTSFFLLPSPSPPYFVLSCFGRRPTFPRSSILLLPLLPLSRSMYVLLR